MLGAPGRFVKNTFSRDKDDSTMGRSDRRDSSSRLNSKSTRGDGSTKFWNKNDQSDQRLSSHDTTNSQMSRGDKPGVFKRMISWRPFKKGQNAD
jgi:hypothetical protein